MNGKFVTLSGVVVAFLSSACCIVPVLALIAGTSGVTSTFSWLEPLRPYFMGLTISILGFAWYKKLISQKKENDCDCKKVKSSFWKTKSFLVIITVVAGLLLAFPKYAHIFYPKAEKKEVIIVEKNDIREVNFNIKGMSCEGCAEHINSTLDKESGVIECKTSYEKGNSIVKFDQTKTSPDSIASAIDKLGYKVVLEIPTNN